MIRSFCGLLAAILMIGCASGGKRGVSFADDYDAVKVDQMVGNNVSGKVFERTILCLNARRETRQPVAITNLALTWVTNTTLTTVTNQTVTTITNLSRTLATNHLATPPPLPVSITEVPGPAADPSDPGGAVPVAPSAESSLTNQLATAAVGSPASSTNQTVTTATNLTLSQANNQLVRTQNYQTLLSTQVTITTNNLSITTADNEAVTIETNLVITTVTNQIVTAVTNQSVSGANYPALDYYLYTELTPPPDFAQQPGESLVLLVDGVRHGFIQTNSSTAFVSRRGFTSTLYKTAPEVFVDIANAKSVKIRLKGVNSVIEKEMSDRSRLNFRKFLLEHLAARPASTASSTSAIPRQSM